MTREEQIRNAVDTTFPIPPSENGRNYEQALMATGFQYGAQWADANPKSPWISVDEDLPYNNPNNIHFGFISFTNRVLTTDGKINIFIAYMKNINNKWVWHSDDNFDVSHIITHWMPFPKLPKE